MDAAPRVLGAVALPCLTVAALALLLALRQVDALLRELQDPKAAAAGLQSLAFGWPDGEFFDRARAVIGVWNDPPRQAFAERCIGTYTWLDLAFIVVYSLLLLRVIRRLRDDGEAPAGWLGRQARTPWPWVLTLAVADVVEDTLLFGVGTGRLPATKLWLSACLGATVVKWLLVALNLGLVVAVVRERRAAVKQYLRDARHALWELRALVLLSVAFGVALLADPTSQTADLVRRWADGSLTWLWSVLATLALCVALWAGARRILLGSSTAGGIGEWWVLGAAAALLVGGKLAHWPRLMGLGVVVLAVGLAWVLRFLFGLGEVDAERREAARADREASAAFPGPAPFEWSTARRLAAIQRVARGLAVWPAIALGLAVVSAFTAPPLVLASSGKDPGWAAWIAIAGGLGAIVAAAATALLRTVDEKIPWGGGAWLLHVAGVSSALALAAALHKPLDTAPGLGVVALVATLLTAMVLVLAELERQAEIRSPPPGLIALGFRRTPVLSLLAAGLLVASLVSPHDDHHNVTTLEGSRPAPFELSNAWEDWVQKSCGYQEGDPIPLVIVGAHGGGMRAAYWTAATMTALIPDPDAIPTDRCGTQLHQVLAMSGISGGSLGLTSYVSWAEFTSGPTWYEQALGEPDSLSSPIAWLAVDGARSFLGFPSEDRARLLERAWERHLPALAHDFYTRAEPPFLLLGGATVESGCRLNVSTLRLGPVPGEQRPGVAECAALQGRGGTVGNSQAPTAPQTTDVVDHLCAPEARLRRSTASLLSARFPYVSPSGRLPGCDEHGAATAVVDGGYIDGTGARSALDLWRQLERLVARHNRAAWRRDRRRGRLVVPIYVQLDNHYTAQAAAAPVGRTQELIAPPAAKLRANANHDRAIEQEVRATFLAALPGIPGVGCDIRTADALSPRYVRIAPVISPGLPAPLAWSLSKMSRDDLIAQRDRALGKEAAPLKALLGGTAGLSCAPKAARSHAPPWNQRTHR